MFYMGSALLCFAMPEFTLKNKGVFKMAETLLTIEGLKELEAELDQLKVEGRKEAAERTAEECFWKNGNRKSRRCFRGICIEKEYHSRTGKGGGSCKSQYQ